MRQKLNEEKRSKGISLVALTVMVVIMVILAGIVYSTLTKSGIIDKTYEAQEKAMNKVNEAQNTIADITNEVPKEGYGSGDYAPEDGEEPENPEESKKIMELIINPNGGEWGTEKRNESLISLTEKEIEEEKFSKEIKNPSKTPVYEVSFDAGIDEDNIVIIDDESTDEDNLESKKVNTEFSRWEKEYGEGNIEKQENGKWEFIYAYGITKIKAIYAGKGIILPKLMDQFGYTFSGWCENADGSGEVFEGGTTYNAEKTGTLHARWDAKPVVVYFNEGTDATVSEESRIVRYGERYDKKYDLAGNSQTVGLPIPERRGYEFLGWDLEESQEDVVSKNINNDSIVEENVEKDEVTEQLFVNLYAKWKEIIVTNVELDKSEMVLVVGSDMAKTIQATVTPSNAYDTSLNWSSSNTTVASVDANGKVTGISQGTATITATSNRNPSVKATCTITVINKIQVSWNNVVIGDQATFKVDNIPTSQKYKFVWYKNSSNSATGGTKIIETNSITNTMTAVQVFENEGKYIYCKVIDSVGNDIQTSAIRRLDINYTITTATHLRNVASLVNGGKNLAGKTITVGNDINLQNNSWTPIGNNSYKFAGTFEGNGKVIKGLYINTASSSYKAVFGYTESSSIIQNLGVEGQVTAYDWVGGIVGYNSGIIKNCYSKVSVKATRNNAYVGGIAGVNNGTIDSCYNLGNVESTHATANGTLTIGGIAGVNNSNAKIKNSYNLGEILVASSTPTKIGGIAGSGSTSNVTNCYYLSTLTVKNSYGTKKTPEEMNSLRFASLLNAKTYVPGTNEIANPFKMITEQRYPALSWQVGTLDTEKPEFENISLNINTIKVKAKDNIGIVTYGLASDKEGTEISEYTQIIEQSEAEAIIDISMKTEPGTYYFWLEDAAGNKIVYDAVINTVEFEKPLIAEVQTPVIGEKLTLSISNIQVGVTYSWYKEGSNEVLGEGSSLEIDESTVINDEGTNYYCIAKTETEEKRSDNVTWNVNYTISTAIHLKGISKIVNSGTTLNGKEIQIDSTINSIELENERFEPIGNASNLFEGKFNGNGKAINGLNVDSTGDNVGLFGNTSSASVISNLTVSGTVKGNTNVGGIVGNSKGTIQNVCSNVEVIATGQTAYVGGIVGNNSLGKIESSYFAGVATATGTYARLGGIVGNTVRGTIKNTYNVGQVINNNAGTTAYTGGIIGYTENGTVLINSYNIKKVVAKNNPQAVVGYIGSSSNFVNNYYADTIGTQSSYSGINIKSIKEINSKRFADTLNGSQDPAPYKMITEQDCPALSWQVGTEDAVAPIISEATAVLQEIQFSATDENGIVIYGLEDEDGNELSGYTTWIDKSSDISINFSDVPYGKYKVWVEDAAGNKTIAGDTVKGLEFIRTKNFAADPIVTISTENPVIGEQVTLRVTNPSELADTETITGGDLTYNWYREVNGTSTLVQSKTSSTSNANVLVISQADVVNYGDETSQVYTYNGTSTDKDAKYYCEVVVDGITRPTTVDKKLWIVNHTITTKEQLKGIATIVNAGTNLKGRIITLGNDIDLQNNSWTPIGTKIGNNSYKFAGTFEGNGKVIKRLNSSTNSNYKGVFGYTESTAIIQNLGVEGSVTGHDYVAGIVGYNNGKIINCYSNVHVKTSWYYAYFGGIVGQNNANGKIENCYNLGKVETTYSGTDNKLRTGGIVGSNSGTVKNCYNIGEIIVATTSATGIGGIAGSSSNSKITNSYYLSTLTVKNSYGTPKTIEEINSLRFASLLNGKTYTPGTNGTASPFKMITEQNYPVLSWQQGTADNTAPVILSASMLLENNSINVDATDEEGIVAYGYSNESGVEQDIQYVNKSTTFSGTFDELVYGKYYIWVEDAAGNKTISERLDLEIKPIIKMQPLKPTIGDTITLSIENTKTGITYEWYKDGDATVISTEPSIIISEADVVNNEGINYYCIAYEGGATEQSDNVNWQVNYVVTTKEQLKGIGTIVNSGTTLEGKTIILGKDIDLEGSETEQWTPIGNSIKQFNGTFDGSGLVIRNIYINAKDSHLALFGNMGATGTVKNLNVSGNITVTGTATYIAGIVAYNSGTIENCGNMVTISTNSNVNANSVGGIAGNSGAGGVIRNCYNTAEISGYERVGGIVGHVANSIIEGCYNLGNVSGEYWDTGGIVGGINSDGSETGGTVKNSYNTGTIYCDDYVGGVVGYLYEGTIENSYNVGSISGNGTIGGISSTSDGSTIQNCYYISTSVTDAIGTSKTPEEMNSLRFASLLNGTNYMPGTNETSTPFKMIKEQNYPVLYWQEGTFDNTAPVILSASSLVDNNSLSVSATDEEGIVAYGYSDTSGVEKAVRYSNKSTSFSGTIEDIEYGKHYIWVEDAAGNKTISEELELTIKPVIKIEASEPTIGETVTLSVENVKTGVSYEWYKEGSTTSISSGASVTISEADVVNNEGINYYCVARDGDSSEQSDNVNWRVNYTVKTKEQLKGIATIVNSGTTLAGKTVTLGNNINLSGSSSNQWIPIGTSTEQFLGTFDGAGKTISNIYISSASSYQGLFGYVGTGAIVRNLNVSGNITGSGSAKYIAGIAGYASGVKIENCINNATVSGSTSNSNSSHIAGIVAFSINSTISKCGNNGVISGYNSIGGIVGENTTGSVVELCYNKAAVSGNQQIGGIVGHSTQTSKINNCYNTASVTGKGYGMGGISGSLYQTSTISNVYNTGVILSTISSYRSYAKAIVGYKSAGTISKAYYLDTANSSSSGSETNGTVKTAAQMKDVAFVTLLNGTTYIPEETQTSGFIMIEEQDYPALYWENGTELIIDAPIIAIDNPNPVIGETTTVTITNFEEGFTYNLYIEGNETAIATLASATLTFDSDEVITYDGKNIYCKASIRGITKQSETNGWTINYTIRTKEQLEGIAKLVNNGTTLSGKTITLGNNINLEGSSSNQWTPIGNSSSYKFAGTFEGNGKIITGLYINNTSSSNGKYKSLFGYTESTAIIQNLGVEGYVNAYDYGAGIVSRNGGKILNCYSNVYVIDSLYNAYFGGIAGTNTGTIEKCYNLGKVQSSYSGSSSSLKIGGIVGSNSGPVKNCYNIGTIIVVGSSSSSGIGGIAGSTSSSYIENSYYLSTLSVGNSYGTKKTAQEIANIDFVSLLNGSTYTPGQNQTSGFKMIEEKSYPVLYWQEGEEQTIEKPIITIDNSNPVIGETITFTITNFEQGITYELYAEGNETVIATTTSATLTFTPDEVVKYEQQNIYCKVNIGENVSQSETKRWTLNYTITTKEQLKGLATVVNNGITLQGKTITLDNNIDLEGNETEQWTAIGTSSNQFEGTFDGNGMEISGIYIDKAISYQGLLGAVGANGIIKNLGVSGIISGNNQYNGGIVGYNRGTIENCFNRATINGEDFLGGIVGYNVGTIQKCYNSGSVTGASYDIGGIAGDNGDEGIIKDCYNTGTVIGSELVGGIVGYNYESTVENCYNTGNISSENYGYAGGIVGGNDINAVIKNCYNTGEIYGTEYIGGLAGYNYEGIIENSYNIGTVNGDIYVGGLVGANDYNGIIKNCYNTNIVSGTTYVAGILGYNYSEGTVENCYNVGTVSGTNNVKAIFAYDEGNLTIQNCYYLSTIAADENATAITEQEMNSLRFASLLNGTTYTPGTNETATPFKIITEQNYPALSWQEGTTDSEAPSLISVSLSQENIVFTAIDAEGIVAYGYEDSEGIENIIYTSKSTNLSATLNDLENGSYYVFVEDASGNKTVSEEIILEPLESRIAGFKVIGSNNISSSGNEITISNTYQNSMISAYQFQTAATVVAIDKDGNIIEIPDGTTIQFDNATLLYSANITANNHISRTGTFTYSANEISFLSYSLGVNSNNSVKTNISTSFKNNQVYLLGLAKGSLIGSSQNASVNISIGFTLGTVTFNGKTYQISR